MSNSENPNLIQCGNHGWVPYHMLCRHLVIGRVPAQYWVQVPLAEDDRREVDGDWICAVCYDLGEKLVNCKLNPMVALCSMDLMAEICLNCCNQLKEEAGFVRDEAGILVRPGS